MANLNGFNAHEVDPNVGFDPIPAGKHVCIITGTEMKPSSPRRRGIAAAFWLTRQPLRTPPARVAESPVTAGVSVPSAPPATLSVLKPNLGATYSPSSSAMLGSGSWSRRCLFVNAHNNLARVVRIPKSLYRARGLI